MESYKSIRILKCDHCGKEIQVVREELNDYSIYKDEDAKRESDVWTSINIGSGMFICNRIIPFYHSLNICPECSMELLEYLKENYDHNATWKPIKLTEGGDNYGSSVPV